MNTFNITYYILFFISFFSLGCFDDASNNKPLTIVKSYPLDVKEPSGLAYDKDQNHLYTVSDKNHGNIYQLDLQGNIQEVFQDKGSDMEGIAFLDNQLFVVEEMYPRIVAYSLQEDRTEIPLDLGITQQDNKGLEGITYNPNNQHFYLLNEANPMLLIEVDKTGAMIKQSQLNFSNDVSGIAYDESLHCLWVVSDASSLVAKLSMNGKLIQFWTLPIQAAEGIAVVNNTLFVVSDTMEKLYLFDKP